MPESLSDKLKSMGLNLDSKKTSLPKQKEIPIEHVLAGWDHDTIYGNTFVSEKCYLLGYEHGNIKLFSSSNIQMLLIWAKLQNHVHELNINDFIFLDAETSGLSGGTGTFAFLIGLGFFTQDGFRVLQLFMRDPGQEEAFLASLTHFVSNFKGVVTFNGKSFDIPLLNSRHILHGLTTPFKDLHHIDLLPLSRRIWRNRLDDRSLKNLEVQILNLARSEEEVPGWMVPEIYFDYLKTHDATPLAGVFYHNLIDIVSLAALMIFTSDLLIEPLNANGVDSLDLIAIARLYEDAGDLNTAIQIYEKSLNQGLPEDFFIQTLLRYAEIYRKLHQWEAAIRLWERAADGYHVVSACIEISKYFEHREKNFLPALEWIEKPIKWIEEEISMAGKLHKWTNELYQRQARLKKKIDLKGKKDVS